MSLVRVGSINEGATPIVADLSHGFGTAIEVLLLEDYQIESPPGYPTRPHFVGAERSMPASLKAGAHLIVHKPEATALIAAGAARIDHAIAVVNADGKRGSARVSEIAAAIVEQMTNNGAATLSAALAPHLAIALSSLAGAEAKR